MRNYTAKAKIVLSFEIIDSEFLIGFMQYLVSKIRITNKTVSKYIKTIKAIMNWSVKRGYTNNLSHKLFQPKSHEGEVYFLTMDELLKLYRMPIQLAYLERVRDVFCFGCFTGLRYSDMKNLSPSNISNGFARITSLKTQEKNSIPLNEFALAILRKYVDQAHFSLPVLSNQKMNEHLKALGKLAGLNRKVSQIRFRGAQRLENIFPLYEVLTTHVARKTFITNSIYLGMNSEAVMEITGQKTRQTFKRYFKIVDQFKEGEMRRTWNSLA